MKHTKVSRVKKFKYLGSTVQKSDSCEREVKKRVQAGWNGWRRVSEVICDRRLPARVKGKVYSSVVRPTIVYGLIRWLLKASGRGGSCRNENFEVWYGSDKKRQD